jgi:hypothetical protein
MNSFISNARGVLALALVFGLFLTACEREPRVLAGYDPGTIEERYGLAGAYDDRVTTDHGALDSTIVPVKLSDGRTAQLVIPRRASTHRVYLQDSEGVHPIEVQSGVSRDEFVRSEPRIVERSVAAQPVAPDRAAEPRKKRSLEKEVLIVAGSAGAGAAIGAVAGGKKGAGVGALTGGVAGLIYDLATRKK